MLQNSIVSLTLTRVSDAVQQEAERIKPGALFQTIYDFDRCIDSWAVIHHRAVARYRTTPDLAIRSCRFGRTVRKFSRKTVKPGGPNKKPPSGSDIDDNEEGCKNTMAHLDDDEDLPSMTPAPASGKENFVSPSPAQVLNVLSTKTTTM